jgi:hypothetical protein
MKVAIKLNGHGPVTAESLTECVSLLPAPLKPRAVELFADTLHMTQNGVYFLRLEVNPQEWIEYRCKDCEKYKEG